MKKPFLSRSFDNSNIGLNTSRRQHFITLNKRESDRIFPRI